MISRGRTDTRSIARLAAATLLVAAALCVLLSVQVAQAEPSSNSGDPTATASAVSASKFKKLKKQVAQLQAQVDQLTRQPGPQGAAGASGIQGPAGSAPGCQGNGSGDVMVSAGAVCIDRYEASVWSQPNGGTQYGVSADDYPCDDTGQDCTNIYARSVAGVTPSAFITYFQAQQALANSGKRLPTSAERQQAVAGTPDPVPGDASHACNVSTGVVASAGGNAGCVSNHGANDMVGNLNEWVGDWVPASTACPGWGGFSDDQMCLAGASTSATGPVAPLRGGDFWDGVSAGPFAVYGFFQPQFSGDRVGFRGAR